MTSEFLIINIIVMHTPVKVERKWRAEHGLLDSIPSPTEGWTDCSILTIITTTKRTNEK